MKFPAYPRTKTSGVEWLGEVPEDWEVKRLDFLASVKARLGWKGLTASEYVPEGFIFLATPNIKGQGEIDFTNVNYITSARYHESPEIMVQVGDVLMAKDGSTLGTTNVVRHLPAPATVNSSIAVLRPKAELNSSYFFRWLTSAYLQSVIQLMKDGQGVPHLFQADIKKFTVLLPASAEQEAIAAFLDRETGRLDRLVAKKQELIERLKEKRTALISQTVTRGLPPAVARAAGLPTDPPLKPSGIEWLGDIPKHWEVRKFSREVAIAEGQVDPEKEPYAAMLLIGPEHVESGTGRLLQCSTAADQAAESGKYLSCKGDVIYSKIRPALRKLVIAPEDCLCSADMYPLRARTRLENRFIAWFFLSEEFSGWSVLESDRVAMPKINRNTLNELRMPVPPLPEQAAIAAYLDAETAKLDALVTKVEEAVERLQEYRTALITAAVTGKMDVRGVLK